MILAIDFDGTLVDHCYPEIGAPVPGAFVWLLRFQELGARLILWTMRSDTTLSEAVDFCRSHGVEFWGINSNPEQDWSASPKAYAHLYIDDMAACCPLRENPRAGGRPYVDWTQVGPAVEQRLLARRVREGG